MNIYTDYQKILLQYNFVGGAGKLNVANGESDPRAIVNLNNGHYDIKYYFLNGKTDFDNIVDVSSGSEYYKSTDREYIQYATGQDEALSVTQTDIFKEISSPTSAYSVSFSDVTNIQFSNDGATISDSHIIIGTTTKDSIFNPDPLVVSSTPAYENDLSTGQNALEHGDIWINQEYRLDWNQTEAGTPQNFFILHELAHSLGLKHIFGDSGNENPDLDSMKYTVTSYTPVSGMNDVGFLGKTTSQSALPSTLQILDIAALQEIYGTRDYTTRQTDTRYAKDTAFDSGRLNDAFIYTIWDGGGIDEISAEGFYESGLGANAISGAEIDLRQGAFSSIGSSITTARAVDNVAIAFHTIIENATGSDKHDVIVGNAWNNELIGGDGNDTLYGDGIVYDGDAGFHDADTLASSYATPWGINGVAPDSNDSGNDILRGGDGHDILKAGLGRNTVYGDAGNDTITVADGASGTYDGGADSDTFIIKDTGNNDMSVLTLIGGDDAGTDTITFENGGYIYDQRDPDNIHISTWDGRLHADIDGFEEVNITSAQVLANVNADYDLTLGPTYDYSFVDGSVTGTVFDIGVFTDYNVRGSELSFHRIVDVEVDINGVNHDGRLINVTYSGTDSSVLHSNLDATSLGSFIGTNNGDTINIHKNGFGIIPVSAGSIDFTLGLGNDVVTITEVSSDKFEFTYKGGNDIIKHADINSYFYGEDVTIRIDSTYAESSILRTGGDDVQITTPKGVLTIQGMNPTMIFSSGETVTIDAASNKTVTPPYQGYTAFFEGKWGKDIYTATDDTNTAYFTLGGDDEVNAGGGNDIIYGYSGLNTLNGGAGEDQIFGGKDTDRINGGADDDVIFGGFGSDVIFVGEGFDTVTGGAGLDTYVVKASAGASDSLTITDFDVSEDRVDLTLLGGAESFNNLAFSSYLGGTRLYVSNYNYAITFEGIDSLSLTESNFLFSTAVASNNSLPLVPSTVQTGTSGPETLTAYAFDGEVLEGLGGDDQLYGSSGNDYLYGGDGNDPYLSGAGGNDVLVGGAGNDHLEGGVGNDYYLVDVDVDSGSDGIYDDLGTDTIILEGSITTSDIGFWQAGDNLTITNQYYSTAWYETTIYNYFVSDDNKVEYIVIQDVIYDLADVYNTGTWTELGNWGAITVTLPDVPTTTQTGTASSETLFVSGVDGEVLNGLGGNDSLQGNVGNDYLYGGDGDDYYIGGGPGNDVLIGGAGYDDLYGGSGDDYYVVDVDADTGFDLIWEDGGSDALILNGSITTSDISISTGASELSIIPNAGFTWLGLDINNYFVDDIYKVEYIVVQDVVYDLADVYSTGIWTEVGASGSAGNAPNAFDDLITIDRGGVVRGNLLNDNGNGADYDPDGTYLEVDPFTATGAYGSFHLYSDGSFTFVGTQNYVGTEVLTYTLRDADGVESTANITLNSIVTNEAPVAQNMDSVVAIQAGSALNFVPNFTDPDGDAITYSATLQDGSALPSYIMIDTATGALTGTMLATSQATIGVRLIAADWMSQTTYDFDLDVYDVITGTTALDYLHGDAGVDTIYGGDGEDRLYGNDGDDELHGENDNDRIYGHLGNDTIYGDSGWDLLYGLQGDDIIFGGIGNDTIRGDDASGADGYVGAGNDEIHGGDGGDNILGGAGADTLYGDAGNDTIYGNAGADTVYGGNDNDYIYGNAGDDELHGDAGIDRIYGHAGNDVIYGDADNDLLYGLEGDDILYGGDGDDRVIGDDDPATAGFVDAGNDVLLGEGGNDVLGGGAGDDLLIGGTGVDALYGNAGADTFAYLLGDLDGSKDYIHDFSIAEGDVINIADVIDYSLANGDAIADFVTIYNGGSYVRVIVDQDGTGTAHTTLDVAQVQGHTGWDLNTLITSGTLIVE